jgi:hypothetical protein
MSKAKDNLVYRFDQFHRGNVVDDIEYFERIKLTESFFRESGERVVLESWVVDIILHEENYRVEKVSLFRKLLNKIRWMLMKI